MSRMARVLAVRKATTHICRSIQHRAGTWGRGTHTQKWQSCLGSLSLCDSNSRQSHAIPLIVLRYRRKGREGTFRVVPARAGARQRSRAPTSYTSRKALKVSRANDDTMLRDAGLAGIIHDVITAAITDQPALNRHGGQGVVGGPSENERVMSGKLRLCPSRGATNLRILLANPQVPKFVSPTCLL